MKSSLLKTVLTTQLESYSAGHIVVNNHPELEELNPNKDPNSFTTRTSEESFIVELEEGLFNELLDLEKQYPLIIHVIDNNTIIITPFPGNVSYNIPIVKSCRYLPAHVIFLVSDIMPFDIQLVFLEHIKCLSIADDTFANYSTGIFNKYAKDFKDLPKDVSTFDSGFIRLPSMFKYTSDIISGIITGNSDHFVTRLQSSIKNWNSIYLKLSSGEFNNPRNEFTVVVDGGKVLNSITTALTLYPYLLLDKDLTLNVIITRPSGYFTLNELVFNYYPGTECPKYPKSITINYFMFDFTMKIITDSKSTFPILYVRNNLTKNCLESKFKDVVKFNIYTSGTRPLDIHSVLSSKVKVSNVSSSLSFESYDRYRTGDTLYNVNVPVANTCPLVDVPDDYLEDNKHANFIYKRENKLPLQE